MILFLILILNFCLCVGSTVDDEVQSYKLWVKLNGTPIGKHRFQLRAIKVNEFGIELKLKVMNEFEYSSLNSVWDDNSHSSFEFKDVSEENILK